MNEKCWIFVTFYFQISGLRTKLVQAYSEAFVFLNKMS
jgi:hypothetical protein